MKKNVLKYLSIVLISITIVFAIINLVNFYSYANVLAKIQSGNLTEIAKFELQESKELHLYNTLRLIPWTCFMSIASAIISAATLIINTKSKNKYNKIR